MSDSTADRGSQAERTTLAWTRTSFAFLANGALLMIRNLHGPAGPTGWIPAALAGVVALGTFVIAVRRQHTLQQRPLPRRLAPRRQVHIIGVAVLALIGVTTLAQLI